MPPGTARFLAVLLYVMRTRLPCRGVNTDLASQHQYHLGTDACVSAVLCRDFFLPFRVLIRYLLRVIVARATSSLDTKWQWWIPVICMYIYPCTYTGGVYKH